MIKLQTAPSSTLPLRALDARYLQPASRAERSWTLRRGSCFGTCQLASPISNKSRHASSSLSFISPPLRSSLSPMPRCPRCSRKCKTDTRLLQHMNHPTSKCIRFLDEVIQISEALRYKTFSSRSLNHASLLLSSKNITPRFILAQLGHTERALHSWTSSMMTNMRLREKITCIIHGPLALNGNLLHFCYARHSAWPPSTNSFL